LFIRNIGKIPVKDIYILEEKFSHKRAQTLDAGRPGVESKLFLPGCEMTRTCSSGVLRMFSHLAWPVPPPTKSRDTFFKWLWFKNKF
jgi:hypothetical protein